MKLPQRGIGIDQKLMKEMMDGIEPHQTDENKVQGNNVIEQARHDQDQNAGDQRNNRRKLGGGDDHWISFKLQCFGKAPPARQKSTNP
jgi:hypothetical protein